MNKFTFHFSGAILFVVAAFGNLVKLHAQQQLKSNSYIDQLFIAAETMQATSCKPEFADEGRYGAMYLSKKGNIIVTLNSEKEKDDTIRYYWGTYSLSNSKISYQLTNEFYYKGKWDASWEGEQADFRKGKSRKISAIDKLVYRTTCDTLSFFRPYKKEEAKEAAARLNGSMPYGLYYFPYYEPKEQKFYLWFFNQVPELKNL